MQKNQHQQSQPDRTHAIIFEDVLIEELLHCVRAEQKSNYKVICQEVYDTVKQGEINELFCTH